MNANELADKLEKDGEGCTCCAYCAGECACDANWAEYHTKEAATLLRQQQAEIEALKAELVRYSDALGEERGNKALKNHEIAAILTQVLDDCGLLKKEIK